MKNLLFVALIALPTTAMAVENPEKYQAYKERMAQRRANALEARREYNSTRGRQVFRTAIAAPAPITPFLAVQKGWVAQPAIPVVPRVQVAYPAPVARPIYTHPSPAYAAAVTKTLFALNQ